MLLLEPLKTADRFLLGEIGRTGDRGRLVSNLRLLSRAPRCGTGEIFRVEPFLLFVCVCLAEGLQHITRCNSCTRNGGKLISSTPRACIGTPEAARGGLWTSGPMLCSSIVLYLHA